MVLFDLVSQVQRVASYKLLDNCALVQFPVMSFDAQFAPNYHIVGFFEVLKFREWLIFGFFMILFPRMGLPKAQTLQWVVGFLEGLNFMNDNIHEIRGIYVPQKNQLYGMLYCKTIS